MKNLPEFMHIQIDDVDDNDVYYSATDEGEDIPFLPSDRHPAGLYKLIKRL